MNTLEQICEDKREFVKQRKTERTLNDLKFMCADTPLTSGFLQHLKMAKGPALIAEVKKASPSRGVIRKDFDPRAIAKIYEQNGAACLSVLTEEKYFQGSDEYLISVKEEVAIPVLRKDFIIDEYQIYESRVLGADCILLIVAALEEKQLWEYYDMAIELGLDVLVEVHDLRELESTLRMEPMMVGVNNRNLKTLEVDIGTSLDLLPHIPAEAYKISESGISDPKVLRDLNKCGYQGFLVGESLMKEDDIATAMKTLLSV